MYSMSEQVLLHLLSFHLCVWVHAGLKIVYFCLLIRTFNLFAGLKRRPASINQYKFTCLQLKLQLLHIFCTFDRYGQLILINSWAEVSNTEKERPQPNQVYIPTDHMVNILCLLSEVLRNYFFFHIKTRFKAAALGTCSSIFFLTSPFYLITIGFVCSCRKP